MPIITLDATKVHNSISMKESMVPSRRYPLLIKITRRVPIATSIVFEMKMRTNSIHEAAVRKLIRKSRILQL